jgi:hypothetical protein
MIRTLNFTGRKRLSREMARIELRYPSAGAAEFEAELDFAGLELPPDARVYIEAAFKSTFMRFAWGTVGQPTPAEDRRLTRLEQPKLAHFRVKVVESVSSGFAPLLAVSGRLEPEGTSLHERRRLSLFRVSYTALLEDEIWRLNFDDAGGPLLELQQSVPGIQQIVRQEAFMALVLPEVVRQILTQVFADGIDDPEDNPDDWRARWLRFGGKLLNEQPPQLIEGKAEEAHEDWIEGVVSVFSQRQKLVTKFKKRYSVVEAEGS